MIATIGNIPVYNALIDDEETRMIRISLVDDPAVMSNFLAFDADKQVMMYAIADEEKRLVHGVVMRADFPIYRISPNLGEFYIIYKADQIRKMAEKYLCESRQNLVNLMHEEDSDVEGVHMTQYYIKDSAKGINPVGFGDKIADGSLFAEFHVVNDEIWQAIKEGTYKGFSLEGVFTLEPNTDDKEVQEIVDELEGQFSKLKNTHKMNKLSRIKKALARFVAEAINCGNVTTDKGILAWDGEEDLAEGMPVYLEDAEGNLTQAEDGEYTTSDNKVIVVVDGKVAEIKDADAEVAPEGDGEVAEEFGVVKTEEGELIYEGEDDLKEGDEVFIVSEEGGNIPAPDGEYHTEDGKVIKVVDGKVESIVDRDAEVAPEGESEEMERLRNANEALRKENEALKSQISRMEKMSVAKPAHKEVTTSQTYAKTGIKGLDNLARIATAK